MKKLLKSSVIIAMLALVVMLATSCGSGKPFKTVEEYANSNAVQSELESLQEAMGDTLEISIYGENNTFVYEYKYTTQIDDSVLDATKNALEKATESQKDTFVDIVNTIPTVVDVNKEDVTFAVRYLNADGTLITEVLYNAE